MYKYILKFKTERITIDSNITDMDLFIKVYLDDKEFVGNNYHRVKKEELISIYKYDLDPSLTP
jgi:hypothetical protein